MLWRNRNIVNLGTLGGTQSYAASMNNRGQIVGWAMNTIPDPYSADLEFTGYAGSLPGTTQVRAVLWDNHGIHDLGTLGGPSALALVVNQRGQIAGQSYTSFTPNPTTGIPTIDAFLWENGKMKDLGSLGGTITYPINLNSRGQVVGYLQLTRRSVLSRLRLGSGRAYRPQPRWIRGICAVEQRFRRCCGWLLSARRPGISRLLLESRRDQRSRNPWRRSMFIGSNSVNSNRQAVGYSGLCDRSRIRAFLWENGGPMVDLNALVEPPSDLYLYDGDLPQRQRRNCSLRHHP